MSMKDIPPEESLIGVPVAVPGQGDGRQRRRFRRAMVQIAQRFDPAFDEACVATRPSSGNNYLGVTLTITATSREQLDELYRTLSTHPMVKVVL
jgi:putative lipoic acid-binding regulatory protein